MRASKKFALIVLSRNIVTFRVPCKVGYDGWGFSGLTVNKFFSLKIVWIVFVKGCEMCCALNCPSCSFLMYNHYHFFSYVCNE